jgi:hypothetical protein
MGECDVELQMGNEVARHRFLICNFFSGALVGTKWMQSWAIDISIPKEILIFTRTGETLPITYKRTYVIGRQPVGKVISKQTITIPLNSIAHIYAKVISKQPGICTVETSRVMAHNNRMFILPEVVKLANKEAKQCVQVVNYSSRPIRIFRKATLGQLSDIEVSEKEIEETNEDTTLTESKDLRDVKTNVNFINDTYAPPRNSYAPPHNSENVENSSQKRIARISMEELIVTPPCEKGFGGNFSNN